ncbi:MAG: methyltransferase domain-containing protein [Coriobacteriia bacterium]|nr:methyltransferase domain-containing protein [Coriobacteriia bacterium]
MDRTTDENTRFWDLYSSTYDAIGFAIPYDRHLDALVAALALEPGCRVLDLGCGTGNLERRIASAAPEGVSVVGVDYSEGMLRRARRKCRRAENVSFVRADLRQPLPFAEGAFDRAVANNVLYALEDKAALLTEVRRVLRPGGTLVLSDPKPDARIAQVVAAHFDALRRMPPLERASGYARTFLTLPLAGLTPMLLSTLVIGRRVRQGEYRFSTAEELAGSLEPFGEVDISSAYAGQSWLAVAGRPGATRAA